MARQVILGIFIGYIALVCCFMPYSCHFMVATSPGHVTSLVVEYVVAWRLGLALCVSPGAT